MNHDHYHQRRQPYQAYSYSDKVITSTGYQLLYLCQEAWKRLVEVNTPLLVFHGGDDSITAITGSKALVEKASSSDKTLEVLDGAYHDLQLEPGAERIVYEKSIRWIIQRV